MMISPIKIKIQKIYDIDSSKNNFTFSPNSKDSNYSSYTRDKTIINYFNKKRKNIKSIINNKYLDLKKSFQYKTFSKNKLHFKTISNESQINNKSILLTSLFNLPIIHSPKIKKSQNNSKIKNNTGNIEENNKIKINEIEKGIKLENYMKDKFYEDIDKKMNNKLTDKSFLRDKSLKERIIKMNKIGLFWGTVFEYCNPLISSEKFKLENSFKQKKLEESDDTYINEYKSKNRKEIKPILYTNSLFSQLKRKEKIKNDILFKKMQRKNLILENI